MVVKDLRWNFGDHPADVVDPAGSTMRPERCCPSRERVTTTHTSSGGLISMHRFRSTLWSVSSESAQTTC